MAEEKIFVLIATISKNVKEINFSKYPSVSDVFYIINCQCRSEKEASVLAEGFANFRKDIEFNFEVSRGLSVNRNSLIHKVSSGIGLIADDDVAYTVENFSAIRAAYQNSDEDFITFKIETPDNDSREYKAYSSEAFKHSKLSVLQVSSIEISFRIEKVLESGVLFDTRFGLGSRDIPKFEEAIFLSDLIDVGLRGVYKPIYAVGHPYESSGKVAGYTNVEELDKKSAALKRLFHGWHFAFFSLVILKNLYVLKFGVARLIRSYIFGRKYRKI